jgi:hypothetical protein
MHPGANILSGIQLHQNLGLIAEHSGTGRAVAVMVFKYSST